MLFWCSFLQQANCTVMSQHNTVEFCLVIAVAIVTHDLKFNIRKSRSAGFPLDLNFESVDLVCKCHLTIKFTV